MSTVTEEQAQRVEDPIDVELIGDSTDSALQMQLGISPRAEVEDKTVIMIGHLRLLVREELGADEDEVVRDLIRMGYGLLDLTTRPAEESTDFATFFYLREVAYLTRRLLWVYAQKEGVDGP